MADSRPNIIFIITDQQRLRHDRRAGLRYHGDAASGSTGAGRREFRQLSHHCALVRAGGGPAFSPATIPTPPAS